MASFNKVNAFVRDLMSGVHDLRAAGDTVKVYLSNAVPDAADEVKTDVAEIAAGNGYTAGGEDAQNDLQLVSDTASMTAVDIVISASGGSIGPFQRAMLYNDTPATPLDPLMGWWNTDSGSAETLLDGESLTIDFASTVLELS